MGELIELREFSYSYDGNRPIGGSRARDPKWYFREFEYKGHGQYAPVIESSYPEMVAIHQDLLRARDGQAQMDPVFNQRWIDIRRYVRDQLSGDVIVSTIEKNYEYIGRYHSDREILNDGWVPYRTKVSHGYYTFHFETAADAVKFALAFGNLISEVEERHPTQYRDVSEEQIQEAAANPYGVHGEHRGCW